MNIVITWNSDGIPFCLVTTPAEILERASQPPSRAAYRAGIEAAKRVVLPRVSPKYMRDTAERELDALPDLTDEQSGA